MAKGQKRSNREIKKPKKAKSASATPAAASSSRERPILAVCGTKKV